MKPLAVPLLLMLVSCGGAKQEAVEEPPKQAHTRKSPKPTASPTRADEEAPPAGGPFIDLDWGTLRGLDVRSGQTTPLIDLAIGAPVRIAGYLVPFDDGTEETSEFLIVPSAGMCVHTPPPPPNQMILTRAQGRPLKMATGAVWIYGKLDLQTGDSPYGQTAYQMNADAIRPYR